MIRFLRRHSHRLAVTLAAAFLFAVGIVFVLSQVALALVKALERDVTYRYFDEALPANKAAESVVQWLAPAAPLDRSFSKAERTVVGTTLTRAWQTHAAALETGIGDGLRDYFTGVAFDRAKKSLSVDGARMVVLTQQARPVFFHADGTIMQVATNSLVARFRVSSDGNKLDAFAVTRDKTVSILRSDVTGWRILSHELREAARLARPGRPAPPAGKAAGVNYYPAATPWSRFWSEFDAGTIRKDFTRIASLGGNAVRIFLPRADFLDASTYPKTLADLKTLLRIAEVTGLKVVPTLFDMRSNYGTATWANDATYLRRVLPLLAASGAIAYVDLKNEADLDMPRETPALVEAWARAMLAVARQIAPELPYTIGWSTPKAAHYLADTLDLITYHDYGPVAESAAALARVRRIAGARPVQVTEIGETSFSLVIGPFPGSAKAQADRLAARIRALAGVDGIFVWTLYDFPNPDPAVIGWSPWVRALQSHFGLFEATGQPKPAAAVVARAFDELATSANGDTE